MKFEERFKDLKTLYAQVKKDRESISKKRQETITLMSEQEYKDTWTDLINLSKFESLLYSAIFDAENI
jgi:hypothetical protein